MSAADFHCLYWHIAQFSTLGSCLLFLSLSPIGTILAFILKHYFKINETKVALALPWPKGQHKNTDLPNLEKWLSLMPPFWEIIIWCTVDCSADSIITLKSAKDFNGNLRLEAVFELCYRERKQSHECHYRWNLFQTKGLWSRDRFWPWMWLWMLNMPCWWSYQFYFDAMLFQRRLWMRSRSPGSRMREYLLHLQICWLSIFHKWVN